MGLAILSVILFHQMFINGFPFTVLHRYGKWAVDVFMLLSGIGVVQSIRKYPIAVYYKRRFQRILPACLLCGVCKCLFSYTILSPTVREALFAKYLMGWHSLLSFDLWFIVAIIIYYLLAPLILRALNRWGWFFAAAVWVVCVAIVLLFSEGNQWPWFTPMGIVVLSAERLPAFVFGMTIACDPRVARFTITGVGDSPVWARLMAFLAGVCFVAAAVVLSIKSRVAGASPVYDRLVLLVLSLGVPSMVSLVIWLVMKLPSALRKPLAIMGQYSLELYLVHEFVFTTLWLTFNARYSWTALFAVAFVVTALAAFGCKWVTSRLVRQR